jgi:AraC-like DNA-binding protein
LWVFESAIGMPAADNSLAAPNGCPKLIILYENTLVSKIDRRVQVNRPGLYFIGNRDASPRIESSPRKTAFIGIEFCPFGAYPFFGIPMDKTVDRLLGSDEIFPQRGREIWETLYNLEKVDEKLNFIQEQLVALLRKSQCHSDLVEFCVTALKSADGRMPIHELERKTGYSWRYLDLLFKQHVGYSPKALARIFRFQKFYRQWARGLSFDAMKEELYDYYYDQAHFTREFKRLTGYTPRRFADEISNEFGRRLSLK